MTIATMAKATGLSSYTLRYYEKKGLIIVNRDPNDHRNYSEKDIEWIKFINRLKETGMQLRDIKEYAGLRYQGDSTIARRLAILKKHHIYVEQELNKWHTYLNNLDDKIALYESMLHKS